MEEGFVRNRVGGAPALHYATLRTQGKHDKPRAVLGIVHGYADYGLRYKHVMEALAEQGIATVAIDMRGHGTSEGPRGACKVFSEFLDDLAELPALLDAVDADAPKFLFGHSFGGLVTISGMLAGMQGKYRGLVLSAPFLGLAFEPPKVKLLAGELASKLLPGIGLPSGLKGAQVTHDEAIASAYDADPLVFKNANARWFTETWNAQKRAMDRASEFTMPFYLAFGGADPVAKLQTARTFYERAASKDKTFVPLDGLYHEILNEPSYRDILKGMVAFMERNSLA
jgi:alpha-beta hydrolase superfamily lysophospholipase